MEKLIEILTEAKEESQDVCKKCGKKLKGEDAPNYPHSVAVCKACKDKEDYGSENIDEGRGKDAAQRKPRADRAKKRGPQKGNIFKNIFKQPKKPKAPKKFKFF